MAWQHRLSNADTMQVVKVISLKLSKVVMLLLRYAALPSHYQVETSASEVWGRGFGCCNSCQQFGNVKNPKVMQYSDFGKASKRDLYS